MKQQRSAAAGAVGATTAASTASATLVMATATLTGIAVAASHVAPTTAGW